MSIISKAKHWGAKTWAAIVAAVAFVIAVIVKLFIDRGDTKSEATVAKAAETKTAGEFKDSTAVAGVVGGAVAAETVVKTEVQEAVNAGPTGSDAQLQAIDNTVSEMSRRRHEEALRRAGKQ